MSTTSTPRTDVLVGLRLSVAGLGIEDLLPDEFSLTDLDGLADEALVAWRTAGTDFTRLRYRALYQHIDQATRILREVLDKTEGASK